MSNQTAEYDAIIIGSGQGGNPLSMALAKRGERVALIESNNLGGTCINTGCTPTKTMVASAQVAFYAREGSRWGVQTSGVAIDMKTVLKRKNERVMSGRTGWEKSVGGDKQPELHRGRARFVGPKQIEVSGKLLSAQRIFIDTGTTPAIPDIDGLSQINYLTNETLLNLEEIPKHLLVLGGGYVGLEFAQMFRRFGSEVTVVQSADQLLPHEDEDIAAALKTALEAEGISFHLSSKVVKAEQVGSAIRIAIKSVNDTAMLDGSHLLVATGRVPQTQDLQLQKAGVRVNEKGFIVVNERLETTAPDVWAIGDVTGGPAFTHISYNDFQIIYGNLYEGVSLSTKTRLVPYAVFTDPPLGRVGMTEREARNTGKNLKIGKVEMTRVARALEKGETQGLMKLVVDAETDRILGAALLASSGDEVVQILSTLMLADQPYTLLKGAIYIHPTIAEGFFGLMESVKPV
jgi:pyruvate/2-oxoglutarate dehydrogenase complex dihydrolipoamide dehydrogenase (E3) component